MSTAKGVVGALMLLALFVAMFIFMASYVPLVEVVITVAVVFAVVAWMGVGIYLLADWLTHWCEVEVGENDKGES